MAEFYEYTGGKYYELLSRSVKVYVWKLELLDYQDGTIREIVVDLDTSNAGSINFTNAQGTCRSCNFTFTNPNNKYSIIENNPFWDRRRFKLYVGLTGEGDTYWFSKGVYITQKANINSHTITVQAVDKYGLLDGTLNVSPIFLKTKFEVGSKIGDVVRQILLQDIGNGMLLDATEPIIDPDIGNQRLYKEFEIDVGGYYGSFLEELMNYYGCDIYYDNMGRLIVNRKFNDDLPYWNFHIGPSYTFFDTEVYYQDPTDDYDFDGVNYVTVQAESEDTNASHTAINHNPQSPVCVEKVGYKAYDNGTPITISVGDDSIDTPERKCRVYAEYVLLQQTCNPISKTFSAPIMPHLDTRQTIRVTDHPMVEDGVLMLVTALTFPFGVANDMNITVANIQWLLTDTESTSLTCEVGARSAPKYTISYSGTVKNANGETLTFPSVSDYEGGVVILQTSGKQNSTYGIDFGYFNADKLFAGWRDNMVGADHVAGSLFTIPAQNVEMTPEWQTPQKFVVKHNFTDTSAKSVYSPATTSNTRIPEVLYLKTADKYSTQLYDGGSRIYSYTPSATGEYETDFLYPANYQTTLPALNQMMGLDYATTLDLSGMTNVTSMTSGTPIIGVSNIRTFKLPPNLSSVTAGSFFRGMRQLAVTWPSVNCTFTGNSFLANCGNSSAMLETFTVPSSITVSTNNNFISNCYMAKQLILECDVESSSGTPFALTIPMYVEDVQLLGHMHFASYSLFSSAYLKNLVIGENVQIDNISTLGNYASYAITLNSKYITSLSGQFSNYNGESITIGTNTITTMTNAFQNMTKLTSLTIPSGTTTIDGCFKNSSRLATLVIGDDVTTIKNISNTSALSNLTLGNSVQTIQNSFQSAQLTSLNIPDSVQTISASFVNNPITTITVGTGLQSFPFGGKTFAGLTSVVVSTNNPYIKSVDDNSVYSKDGTILYCIAPTVANATIASGTTTLKMNSIGHTSLSELIIPASVTAIEWGAFRDNITLGVLEIDNPTLTTTNLPYTNVSKIRGYAGSTAETFANDHNITFEAIT